MQLSTKDKAEISTGVRNILTRRENEWNRIIDALMFHGGIGREDAITVAKFYRASKILVRRRGSQDLNVVHGSFFDRDVIGLALQKAQG